MHTPVNSATYIILYINQTGKYELIISVIGLFEAGKYKFCV